MGWKDSNLRKAGPKPVALIWNELPNKGSFKTGSSDRGPVFPIFYIFTKMEVLRKTEQYKDNIDAKKAIKKVILGLTKSYSPIAHSMTWKKWKREDTMVWTSRACMVDGSGLSMLTWLSGSIIVDKFSPWSLKWGWLVLQQSRGPFGLNEIIVYELFSSFYL